MKRIEVAAGLLIRNQRFLIAQRAPGDACAGLWEFPGGKLESGETPHTALRRELAEEIGINVNATIPLLTSEYDYPDFCVYLHFLHVLEYSGNPFAREGQTLAWVSGSEAQALEFLPADTPLLTRCLELLETGNGQE